MKNAEITTNFIFFKKNLQTNVARIWFVTLKQYMIHMMFESIFLIGDMSISKAYAVEFVMSLASLKVN